MRKFQIVIIVILLIFINVSCSKTSNQQNVKPKIKVGYLSLASSLPLYVAIEKGYFDEMDIEVELFNLKSSNELSNAMLAGKIDITSIGALSVWMAIEQQSPNTIKTFLMTYADKNTTVHRFLARKDSGIKTLKDLNNKTIGTFPGLQMKVFTELILNEAIDSPTYEHVPLSPPLQKDALASGRIDALFCLEPVGTICEENGIGYVISVNPLYDYILQPFPTAASVVSNKYYINNTVTAKKYIKAILKAVSFIKSNPDQARSYIPKYTSIPEEFSSKVGIYDFWTYKDMNTESIQKLADIYTKHGILKEKLNTNEMIFK